MASKLRNVFLVLTLLAVYFLVGAQPAQAVCWFFCNPAPTPTKAPAPALYPPNLECRWCGGCVLLDKRNSCRTAAPRANLACKEVVRNNYIVGCQVLTGQPTPTPTRPPPTPTPKPIPTPTAYGKTCRWCNGQCGLFSAVASPAGCNTTPPHPGLECRKILGANNQITGCQSAYVYPTPTPKPWGFNFSFRLPVLRLPVINLPFLNPVPTPTPVVTPKNPGPGGCTSDDACSKYCSDQKNYEECLKAPESEKYFKGPGGCTSKESCTAFCQKNYSDPECKKMAGQYGGGFKGPGGCSDQASCTAYCKEHYQDSECQKMMGQYGGFSGPGGCNSMESCMSYCKANPKDGECAKYAGQYGGGSEQQNNQGQNQGQNQMQQYQQNQQQPQR